MSLKDLVKTPVYTLKLPSNGKELKYRPFIVAEEKALLIALQEDKVDHVLETLKSIINACTFNTINVDNLPTVDVEYLFVMLRNKSLGEGLSLQITCDNCGKKTVVDCNLDKITTEGESKEGMLELSPELKVSVKFPTLKDTLFLDTDKEEEHILKILANCIELIDYNGKIYETAEYPEKERIEFVEHLTQGQVDKLIEWLKDLPEITFTDSYTCAYCNTVNTFTLKGMTSFFA